MEIAREIVLDIGCGDNKLKNSIGLDIRRLSGVDIICNIEQGLPVKTATIDKIWCYHVLEHMSDIESFLKEGKRVLKDSGSIIITVPHFSNTLAYSDYTHKRFFGFYTFDYFSRLKSKYWSVPTYVSPECLFLIERKKLVFRNITFLGKVIEAFVNWSEWTAYLYESKLSWLLPCSEITVSLKISVKK